MCPVCGGNADQLGLLGAINQWRCRDCGVWFQGMDEYSDEDAETCILPEGEDYVPALD